MPTLIVGTAGHIDHGKSALVRALTGTDPDRLPEEKERGITIDLGFAHADLGGGAVVSFVDVPGHERFVRNMLAGAHGIDAVLLVVAADESVMPQTREHFHICRLLGVARGLVALTKCDLADADTLALAEMEARELVAGSFLAGAPLLRVSARTGEGLGALREELRRLAGEALPRAAGGLLRLPVDRVFTLRGFGTVVTGTLVSGTLLVGDELEVLPSGRRGRARGLHVHGESAARVEAGHRAAVNLAGLEVADLGRGDVLTRPGALRPASILEVDLELLPLARPLKDLSRVRVHVASAERLARVRLLGGGTLAPGSVRRAQLRLEAPAAAGRGDRLVLRSFSPAVTVGGAVVLDPLARGRLAGTAPRLDHPHAAAEFVRLAGTAGADLPTLAARLTQTPDGLRRALEAEAGILALPGEPPSYLSAQAARRLGEATLEALEAFHRREPLRAACPREELRRRVFVGAPAAAFEHVTSALEAAGQVRLAADGVSRRAHEVRLSGEEEEVRAAALAAAEAARLAGFEVAALAGSLGRDVRLVERVGRVLRAEGVLVRVGEALVARACLEALKDDVRRRYPPGSRLDVGAFKEMTGLTRKHVIPLLEYLDRERVTRRAGADRHVIG
jgi:selenocysteine-specific elongation factor